MAAKRDVLVLQVLHRRDERHCTNRAVRGRNGGSIKAREKALEQAVADEWNQHGQGDGGS